MVLLIGQWILNEVISTQGSDAGSNLLIVPLKHQFGTSVVITMMNQIIGIIGEGSKKKTSSDLC